MTRSQTANPNYLLPDHKLGSFPRSFHLEMVHDQRRVAPIKKAIEKLAQQNSDTFCELGCGSGIFSIFACQFFDKVVAIEADSNILEFAKLTAEQHGVLEKITFVEADVTDAYVAKEFQEVSVLFAELLSIWTIEEPQILAIENFRQSLSSNAIICPSKVVNLLSAGWFDYHIEGFLLKAPIGQFATPDKPTIVTETRIAEIKNFYEIQEITSSGSICFRALNDELINCVCLSSFVEFANFINFSGSDSLMPTTTMPTTNEITVKAGQDFYIDFTYQSGNLLEEASFSVRLKP